MGDDFDRPAYYEQGGAFFDAHDREIVPGQPLAADVDDEPEQDAEVDELLSPADLVAKVDSMPWAKWAAEAKRVLGPGAPRGKPALLEALKEAIQKHAERKSKRAPAVAAPAPVGKGDVDLAAWARGQQEYLSGDVFKALKQKHSVNITERRDAVDFLITEGVIKASEARADV